VGIFEVPLDPNLADEESEALLRSAEDFVIVRIFGGKYGY